jgi:hypothetical protein
MAPRFLERHPQYCYSIPSVEDSLELGGDIAAEAYMPSSIRDRYQTELAPLCHRCPPDAYRGIVSFPFVGCSIVLFLPDP